MPKKKPTSPETHSPINGSRVRITKIIRESEADAEDLKKMQKTPLESNEYYSVYFGGLLVKNENPVDFTPACHPT